MPTKIVIKIQGNLYDLWEVRSFEKHEEFSETANNGDGGMEYLIVMNRVAIATNANEIVFRWATEEERNSVMERIQEAFDEFEGSVMILTGK